MNVRRLVYVQQWLLQVLDKMRGSRQYLNLASTTRTLYYQAMVRDRIFIPTGSYGENKEWQMFEILDPENQLETSMNITPRQKMLMAPIKRRYSNETSSPENKPGLSAMDLRRRAQNRASQRAFRERKELHTEYLQQQVHKLQTTNQHLFEANVQSVGKLSGMKAYIEGLNLEITMLRIELHPQQGGFGGFSGNASFDTWEQGRPEKALSYFDLRSDVFGFHTSLDLTSDQSGEDAALDRHSAFSPSRVKTSIGTEVIHSRTRKVAEAWT